MSAPAIRAGPSLWGGVFLFLIVAGALSSLLALTKGTGFSFRLDDAVPWGLCVGLDVFCGVALATGALWVAAVAQTSGLESWRTIRSASLCIGVAAYAVAILGAIASLGVRERAWPAVIQFWSPRSIVSGAVWTVLLLATLMVAEFSSRISSASPREWWLQPVRHLQVALLIAVAVLASMHQIGLTRVITLAQSRFLPLWSGPRLALQFILSSICAALAVLLFASWRSLIAFGKRMPMVIVVGVGRVLTIAVFLYLALRLTDLVERGFGPALFAVSRQGGLLSLEIALFLLGMMLAGGRETNPKRLYYGSAMIMAGVVTNRLNTSITALEQSAGEYYQPNWVEVSVAYCIVAIGAAIFAVCVKHLPVFVTVTEGE